MIENIKDEILNCKKCDLHKTRGHVALGDWNPEAKIMFIGIAPGRLGADMTGIPFTKDKSGIFFRSLLEKFNIPSEDVDITNVVRCNPKNEKGNNRNPSLKEIQICSLYLDKEIQMVNPKIIVPLGKIPTEFVLKKKVGKMEDYHGKVFNVGNTIVFPLYHPSYIVNYPQYDKKKYEEDFAKIKDLKS